MRADSNSRSENEPLRIDAGRVGFAAKIAFDLVARVEEPQNAPRTVKLIYLIELGSEIAA